MDPTFVPSCVGILVLFVSAHRKIDAQIGRPPACTTTGGPSPPLAARGASAAMAPKRAHFAPRARRIYSNLALKRALGMR